MLNLDHDLVNKCCVLSVVDVYVVSVEIYLLTRESLFMFTSYARFCRVTN